MQITSRTKWRSRVGMFCKLPPTASSAHLSLLPASFFRHLISLLLNRVTKRTVTDLTGKTQAVLSVDGEAVPGGEQTPPAQGRSPRRSAPDLSAVREGDLSDRLHSTRRPRDWCALRARSTVSWSALVNRVHGAVRERVPSYSVS